MPTQVIIGAFFVVLALIFGVAAGMEYSRGGRPTAAVKTRRKVAIIFAIVGLGLIVWHFVLRTP